MESVSPNIFVHDMQATVDFYSLLGFNVIAKVPDEGPSDWVMMNKGQVNFMFQTFESLGADLPQITRGNGGSLLLYCQVKAIRTFYDQIKDKVRIIKGLEKTFYGATEFSIVDNNDYILTFAEDEIEGI